MTDYFSLLGISPDFTIDLQALEASYFKQQRLFHPDRFVGKTPVERNQAMQYSVDVNQAYNTLKNPLSRAQYLLRLQGITVGSEKDSIKPSPALLMETMEWREQIEEAQDNEKTTQLDGSLSKAMEESIQRISVAHRARMWEPMAQETLRLGYLIKAQEAVTLQKQKIKRQAS